MPVLVSSCRGCPLYQPTSAVQASVVSITDCGLLGYLMRPNRSSYTSAYMALYHPFRVGNDRGQLGAKHALMSSWEDARDSRGLPVSPRLCHWNASRAHLRLSACWSQTPLIMSLNNSAGVQGTFSICFLGSRKSHNNSVVDTGSNVCLVRRIFNFQEFTAN